MNRMFAEEHPGDTNLDARLRSYELAAKMQLSVPETTDKCHLRHEVQGWIGPSPSFAAPCSTGVDVETS